MLTPGRKYINSPVRIAANLQDEDGTDIDPTTVVFRIMSPSWNETTYTYGTDAQLVKVNTGDYYVDFTPDEAGRWAYRWQTTGTNKTIAFEGEFRVMASDFYEYSPDGYRP
jgi:hypothetical protein